MALHIEEGYIQGQNTLHVLQVGYSVDIKIMGALLNKYYYQMIVLLLLYRLNSIIIAFIRSNYLPFEAGVKTEVECINQAIGLNLNVSDQCMD